MNDIPQRIFEGLLIEFITQLISFLFTNRLANLAVLGAGTLIAGIVIFRKPAGTIAAGTLASSSQQPGRSEKQEMGKPLEWHWPTIHLSLPRNSLSVWFLAFSDLLIGSLLASALFSAEVRADPIPLVASIVYVTTCTSAAVGVWFKRRWAFALTALLGVGLYFLSRTEPATSCLTAGGIVMAVVAFWGFLRRPR